MKYYTETHKYTCGVDLHAKSLYLCIFDNAGKKLVHRNMRNEEKEFLRVVQPYRAELVVSVESTFNWYWLGDLCARENIPFVLGHAQYMKSIHQGKTKNDRIDSEKIAKLTASLILPKAYAYPVDMRKVRDLLRRRLTFVRERAALKGHVRIVGQQYNVALTSEKYQAELLECFTDNDLRESVDCDIKTVKYLDSIVNRLERYVLKQAKIQDERSLKVLKTVPGIGDVLGLTVLYEMHNIKRFRRCQDFMSYARLVSCKRTSDGKVVGKQGRKIGNPYLKWAFSEIAVQMARVNPEINAYVEDLKLRYGPAGAWSRLSKKAARTVYYMLKNNQEFSMESFMKNSKEALESKHNSLEPEVAMVID